MKITSKILIILAGTILLMHAILPHEHDDQIVDDYEIHVSANSLLDIIELAFHFDLGENHLEVFKSSTQTRLTLAVYLIEESVINIAPILLSEDFYSFQPHIQQLRTRYLYQNLQFRGPPQLA